MSRDSTPVTAVTALLLPRRTEPCSEKSPPAMVGELDNTATSIRRARPSQSDTQLVRTDLESWREPTSHQVLTDKTPLLSLPRPQLLQLLPQFNKLPQLSRLPQPQLARPSTTTTLMSQLTPTSTHSSTPMTQPTVTSDSTPTEPNLPPSPLPHLPATSEFLPAPTAPESTPSSTHSMLPTSKLVFSPDTRSEFNSDPNQQPPPSDKPQFRLQSSQPST